MSCSKEVRTPEENDMLDMMLHGGERVSFVNLKVVLDWYMPPAGRSAQV